MPGTGSARGSNASATTFASPTLITGWEDFVVEGGVLYACFYCGPTRHCVAMGPSMAFEAIDRARKALQRGVVERLLGDEERPGTANAR